MVRRARSRGSAGSDAGQLGDLADRHEVEPDAQRVGECREGVGRGVGLAALDPADIGLRNARGRRELLLGKACGQPLLQDAPRS